MPGDVPREAKTLRVVISDRFFVCVNYDHIVTLNQLFQKM